jgi:branched-chain amino acid transport system permease protein
MSALKTASAVLAKRSTLWIITVPLVLGAVLVALLGTPLVVGLYTFFCVNVMLVLGLQMFMGNSGILNWTFVGFMGIGAYAASIMSVTPLMKHMGVPNMYPALVKIQLPIPVSLLLGGLVAAAIAAVIAWPLMRLSDAVGVITLFATLIVMHVVMTQWDNVTNGPRTFFGLQSYTTIWVALIGALVTVFLAYFFRESSLGLKLRASRDDRFAAMAIGVNVVQVRYFSYILSAFIGGVGGGVWAYYITSFSPKSFYIAEAFLLLTMLVIGGAGSVSGAFVGTAGITVMHELLRQAENTISNSIVEVYGLTELAMAVLLVVVLIWKPGGVIGGRELTWPLFGKKKRRADGFERPVDMEPLAADEAGLSPDAPADAPWRG